MTREQAETKAIEVLKALQERTEIDYCGLFESEVINLIADKLEVEDKINDTVSFSWHIEDVKSINDKLTDEQAREVLGNFEKHHEGSMEAMWEDLAYHVREVQND